MVLYIGRSVARVLMFNLTGDREPETLLRHLVVRK